MQSPSTTYTTIPISGGDVISRSLQNLTAFVCRARPWSDLISAGVFDVPESFSCAGDRLRKNCNFFRLNYAIFVSACVLMSLIGTPLSLLFIAAIFTLWLILCFFREDPLYLWGHQVSDRLVLVVLISVSILAIWFTGAIGRMIVGLGIGLAISALHGLFRNPVGLFLDENEAMSKGLIRPPACPAARSGQRDTTT